MSVKRCLFFYLYKIASLAGITPFFDFEKQRLVAETFCGIYCIILTGMTSGMLFLLCHYVQYNTENKLIVFLINCTMFTSCLSINTMTICSITKKHEWKRMLHLIGYAENVVYLTTEDEYKKNKTICKILFCFLFSSLIYSVYEVYTNITTGEYIQISMFYLRYVTVIFISLTLKVCGSIHQRFQDLNGYIKLRLLNTAISKINFDKFVLQDISNIRRNFRILNDLVESFNNVFGATTVAMVLNVLLHILQSMNIFIFEWKHCSVDINLTIKSFVPTTWFCVSLYQWNENV